MFTLRIIFNYYLIIKSPILSGPAAGRRDQIIERAGLVPHRKNSELPKADRPGTAFRVSRLDQVRALADPLRLRILGVFGRGPHTTKQAADQLGEKPTRLYHHVEALEKAGLIVLRETRPKRGTSERYYEAVATRFEVDHSLLSVSGAAPVAASLGATAESILALARDELLRLPLTAPAGGECEESLPLVLRAEITATPERIGQLGEQLLAVIDQARSACGGARDRKEAEYALTIALVPKGAAVSGT
jgi:DNA-binding transcriptional ArsR family regulator